MEQIFHIINFYNIKTKITHPIGLLSGYADKINAVRYYLKYNVSMNENMPIKELESKMLAYAIFSN